MWYVKIHLEGVDWLKVGGVERLVGVVINLLIP
jgi:hypothetical protein